MNESVRSEAFDPCVEGAIEMSRDDQGPNHMSAEMSAALRCIQEQRWNEAEQHLLCAQARQGQADPRIPALLERVTTNAKTMVHRPLHIASDLKTLDLLAPPALRLPANLQLTGSALPPRPRVSFIRRALTFVLAPLLDVAIATARATRNRGPIFSFDSWDERRSLWGVLELAAQRRGLNGDKLQSTYEGGLVGLQQPGQQRPDWTRRFRTATGAWNTDDPMEGAAGTEFQRTGSPLIAEKMPDGSLPSPQRVRRNRVDDPQLPSPREVSRRVLMCTSGRQKTAVSLNLFTIAWIQSQVHDWVSHRPTLKEGFYEVPLSEDDPLRTLYGLQSLQVPRTEANPIEGRPPLTFLNEVTHWWDASHLYGSDQETQDRLRSHENGKLRMDRDDLLPAQPRAQTNQPGLDDSGFTRNWWVGLCVLHILFVKHHNHICDELRKDYPQWSDDELFNTARLINAAILAKIHTLEWTTAVLANDVLVRGMEANWWGAFGSLKPVNKRRVTTRFEPLHEVLGGLVGGLRDNHSKPFGLSEEFTEIYRLHAGLPQCISIRPLTRRSVSVSTDATRGASARALVQEHGVETLLNSFGHQHMPALVHNNYPNFLSGMSVEGQGVFDMGTVDILRARERGVPPYNEFRRMLGLKPIGRFDDLGCSAEMVHTLEDLYGKGVEGVEKLDLLAGTSCELYRPDGYGFGETMFTVFIQMASRRLQADPFYTEKFNEHYYTPRGIEMIEKATLKDILLKHYPNLENTGLAHVKNAFEPWGTTHQTDPEEHPLDAIVKYGTESPPEKAS